MLCVGREGTQLLGIASDGGEWNREGVNWCTLGSDVMCGDA